MIWRSYHLKPNTLTLEKSACTVTFFDQSQWHSIIFSVQIQDPLCICSSACLESWSCSRVCLECMGVRSVSAFVYVPEEAGACAWRIMFSDSERSPSASPSVNKHRRADRPSQKQPNTPERVGQGRRLNLHCTACHKHSHPLFWACVILMDR